MLYITLILTKTITNKDGNVLMAYFGISAKNEEQKLALRALDNDKPITILTGPSGVGKSLLAQAVGLEKL